MDEMRSNGLERERQTADNSGDWAAAPLARSGLDGANVREALRAPDRLPKQMVITIDGQARTGKNTAGELVAEAIGGVLVDSGRFYRALTNAALLADINLEDAAAVAEFCTQVRLEVRFARDGGRVEEALVSVNGVCFSKAELNAVGAVTPKLARVRCVRERVNNTLRRLRVAGRIVVLGRDMGTAVFPDTPFQFVLTAPCDIREQRDSGTSQSQAVADRDAADAAQTANPLGAVVLDTASLGPEEVRQVILQEIAKRAIK